MTLSLRNKGVHREPPLLGDQGQPWCRACNQRPTYGTDHDGRLVEYCRCGSRVLTPIGCYIPIAPSAPPTPRPHVQLRNHPWKRGAAARMPS